MPDYRSVIRAVTRRDRARALIDGMTAANDLGLTTAVPARIEVLVDARLKPIRLGNQEIHFRYAAPSRLYWADRPAMRIVQALHWIRDVLPRDSERQRVQAVLRRLLVDPRHGQKIREDLRDGLTAMPIWMQEFLRDLIAPDGGGEASGITTAACRSVIATPARSVSEDGQSLTFNSRCVFGRVPGSVIYASTTSATASPPALAAAPSTIPALIRKSRPDRKGVLSLTLIQRLRLISSRAFPSGV